MWTRVPFIIAFAWACGGDAAEWGGTVETLPGGGRLVHNPTVGVWEIGDGAGWRLEEELRIGEVEGKGPAVFGDVGGVFSATQREAQVCVPASPGPPIGGPVEDLVGEYRLIFIGTSGEGHGKRVEGNLVLRSRPEELRPVLALDLTPLANVSEPLYGSTTADLEGAGAYVNGSLTSDDPEAPGGVVRVVGDGTDRQITLELGSDGNRRDRWFLDGAHARASVLAAGEWGFSGLWDATIGPTTYRAGGYFCALDK